MNWGKLSRRISIAIICVIQVLFLLMIFRENLHANWISLVVVLLSVLLLTAHIKAPLHRDDHLNEHVLVAVWIPAAAIAAYVINNNLHFGPVIAASLIGFLGSLLPQINKRSVYLKQLPAAIYCGAFIGMSNLRVANGFLFVFAASFFAGVGLVLSKSLFHGMGGKLGLLAFAGVVLASFFLFLWSNYGY